MPLSQHTEVIGTIIVLAVTFLVWVVRSIFDLRQRLDRDYMTRHETARFFSELMAPVHRSFGEIKEEQRIIRRNVDDGFREVRDRLDKKVDRRNGTG